MKNIKVSNIKKIIIFTLLVIGIILVSPLLNKEIYAKTGQLPSTISKDALLDITGSYADEVSKKLHFAEQKYSNSTMYKRNDDFIKSGKEILPPVRTGDEFWTANVEEYLQEYDDNYHVDVDISKKLGNAGETKINAHGNKLSPFVFQDLMKYSDVYCAFKGMNMFQQVSDIAGTFGLVEGSNLARRLRDYSTQRSADLGRRSSRDEAFLRFSNGLSAARAPLDEYGYRYKGSTTGDVYTPTASQMKDVFNYDYPGSVSRPSYPYAIKKLPIDKQVERDSIVPWRGPTQYTDTGIGAISMDDLMKYQNGRGVRRQLFDDAVQHAVEAEVGKFYNPNNIISTSLNTITDSVADVVGQVRTDSHYELHEGNVLLTPQAAYALAMAPKKTVYPSIAQQILWTLTDSKYRDLAYGSGYPVTDYKLNERDHKEAIKIKEMAKAFEAHYKNLVKWKNKNKEKEYRPEFLETERDIIFNAKSSKYEGGSWIVGPYKLDYLLSTVEQDDEKLYFAGMYDMIITGKYVSSNGTTSVREIKEWSFFVPLSTTGKGLTPGEISQGVETTDLKYGVPEPNQEFYIEIPYDENLIAISKLKARFKALDYDVRGNYYLGVGEYINFRVDIALERYSRIANGYINVAPPRVISFTMINSNTDIGRLVLEFDYVPYLNGRYTSPFVHLDGGGPQAYQGWERVAGHGRKRISTDIPFSKKDYQNFNNLNFYYETTAVNGENYYNKSVVGGIFDHIAFSKGDNTTIALSYEQKQKYPTLKFDPSPKSSGNNYIVYTNIKSLNNYNSGKDYQNIHTIPKGESEREVKFHSEGGQSITLNVPPKDLTITGFEHSTDENKYQVRTNLSTTNSENGGRAYTHTFNKLAKSRRIYFTAGNQEKSWLIPALEPSGGSPGGPGRPDDMVIHKNKTIEEITGRTNNHASVVDMQGTATSYGNEYIYENYTYVLHKVPELLVVPRTSLGKYPSQPQLTVRGEMFYTYGDAELEENINTPNDPAFLLPIGGRVWEDETIGDKLAGYNFILDKNDKAFKDIPVRVNRLIIRNSDLSIVEKQEARVFEKGKYTKPLGRDDIKTDDKGVWGKYYLRDLGFTKQDKDKGYNNKTHIVKFEVEFEYDGLEYMPVTPLATLDNDAAKLTLSNEQKIINDSAGAENIDQRDQFNQAVGEIQGKEDMKSNRETTGKAIGVSVSGNPSHLSGSDIDLKYKGEYDDHINRTKSKLETKLPMTSSILNSGLLYPLGDVYSIDVKQAMKDQSATTGANGAYDLVIVMDNTKISEFQGKKGVTIQPGKDNTSIVIFHEANTHMENINLGLMERRKIDLELESDLMLSVQFVNKKALINNYGNKYEIDKNENLVSKYNVNSDDIQYQLDVYKADYIYRTAMYEDPVLQESLQAEAERLKDKKNDESGRELDIYLQYKQLITNQSQIDHAIISGLNMYYDKSLVPVLDKTIIKEIDEEEIDGKQVTGKTAVAGKDVVIGTPEYKIVKTSVNPYREFGKIPELYKEDMYTKIALEGGYNWAKDDSKDIGELTSLDNGSNILLPSGRRLEVLTNFRVLNTADFIESGIQLKNAIVTGNKHHLTEIAGYVTYNKFSGKVSGKIDLDSAPGNINLELLKFTTASFKNDTKQDFSFLEDDSAVAPIIAIELTEGTPRIVSGRIWEEKRNTQVARVNMGDGIFNASQGEKGIPGKVVGLEERVSIRATDLSSNYKRSQKFNNKILKSEDYYVDIPYIWNDKVQDSGGIISIDSLKARTGFQSYVRTSEEKGKEGEYVFTGIPAGNFVAQLPYISVGNESTAQLDINLGNGVIETTPIVDIDERHDSPQVYNGQDFKVSIYDGGNIDTVNETWMPIEPKKDHSYGRDSEYQRFVLYNNTRVIDGAKGHSIEVLNLGHDEIEKAPPLSDGTTIKEYIESTANMLAETPVMNLGLDYYSHVDTENTLYEKFEGIFALPGITAYGGKIDPDTEKDRTKLRGYSNVNIALEERPKTKLVLDKEVSRLILKSSDGTKIVDAKYNTTYDDEGVIIPDVDKKVMADEKSDKKLDATRSTANGYSTAEYVLQVKTEVDKESINGDKVTPLNTMIYTTKKPYWEEDESPSGLYTNARGWENIDKKDNITRNSNGYIHLNFDKQLLSDTNIEIEYQVQLYNLGEVDRATIQDEFKGQDEDEALDEERIAKYVGVIAKGNEKWSKLNHEKESDEYGFGRFFGRGYYTGKYTEDKTATIGSHKMYEETVAKSTALMVIDYVDNSAVKDDLQNDDWAQIKSPDELENTIAAYDDSGVKTFELTTSNMADPDGKSYFKTGGSNIYVNEKMNTGLVPFYEYITAKDRGEAIPDPYNLSSTIAIKRLSSEQADDDLSFDNIAEIVKYTTDTGRRSTSSTPGNINTRLSETFKGQYLEPDTGLALLVTITPPTGLSEAQRTVISTLNITLAAMAGVAIIAVITKVAINNKTKTNSNDENLEA